MQTTYGVHELAERWGLTTTTIRKMEQDGKLHRLPDMPGVKYPAEEVFQLENIGPAAKALTPWERKQMKEEIEGLKQQVKDLQERLLKAQAVLQGVSL